MTSTQKRWDLLAAVLGGGLTLALLIFVASPRLNMASNPVLIRTVLAAVFIRFVTFFARMAITRRNGRIFLVGRYPFILGLLKLLGLIAVFLLGLLCGVGLLISGSFGKLALDAFILSALLFVTLSSAANSLLDAAIIARHICGTLAATSRDHR